MPQFPDAGTQGWAIPACHGDGSGMEVQGARPAAGLVARTSHYPLAFPWLCVGFHAVLSLLSQP